MLVQCHVSSTACTQSLLFRAWALSRESNAQSWVLCGSRAGQLSSAGHNLRWAAFCEPAPCPAQPGLALTLGLDVLQEWVQFLWFHIEQKHPTQRTEAPPHQPLFGSSSAAYTITLTPPSSAVNSEFKQTEFSALPAQELLHALLRAQLPCSSPQSAVVLSRAWRNQISSLSHFGDLDCILYRAEEKMPAGLLGMGSTQCLCKRKSH